MNSQIQAAAAPTPPASFDLLPPEIIQLIFSFCPSPSLPLSSITVAAKLSNERMYMRCGVSAFLKPLDPDSDADPIEGQSPSDSPPAIDVALVLRCRWLTWSRFQSILRATRDAFSDMQGGGPGLLPALVFDDPSKQPPLAFTTLGPSVSLPSRLLHGPWTDDKVRFLSYLTWLGLGVDWQKSTAGETATQGLQDAIEARNASAVAALLTEHIGLRPAQDDLRFAIMRHGCDRTVVFHLLSAAVRAKARDRDGEGWARADNVNPLDASIWSWVKRLEDVGDPRSKWLKGALRAASDLMKQSASRPGRLHDELASLCGRVSDGVQQIEMRWE